MTSVYDLNTGPGNQQDAGQGREVEFRFFRKDAAQVWVAGDFTGWQSGCLAMHRQPDGWWRLSTPLPVGEYRFRYVADEQNREVWFTDFAAHGVEFARGGWNSVLVVPSVQRAAPETPQTMMTTPEQRLAA